MNKQEQDDGDQILGRPHSPREDEEERDGLRVVSSDSEDEEEEIELHDDDILFDDDDRADLDIEPDDDRNF